MAEPGPVDSAVVDRAGDVAGAVGHAVLNVPIGEVEAAVEGRPATREDRRRTVRDVAGPNADRAIDQSIAKGKVAVEAGGRAMAAALPAIRRAVEEAREEIERATANLPQPDYPRR